MMQPGQHNAPTPDLRIVMTSNLRAHEHHDSQRSEPLMERLQNEKCVINPPIVAPMETDRVSDDYVILDGANRCFAFSHLGYPHIIAQVVNYDSGYVELQTWRHVVSGWDIDAFLEELRRLPNVSISEHTEAYALAHLILRDGQTLSLLSHNTEVHQRNAVLREVVNVYQRNANLYRTASSEPEWELYPEGIALVVFPPYQPADIIAAARHEAFIPPGISRHIIHGRALRVNYPLELLRDDSVSLADKNAALQRWLQDKLARRQVRYYAEATYQFDE
jgi:hypothetical protein